MVESNNITNVKNLIQIDQEILDNISVLLEEEAGESVKNIFASLHPADIAEIINHIKLDEAIYAFNLLTTEVAGEVVIELDEDLREKILRGIEPGKIADIVDELDSDDAVDIVSDLPEDVAFHVLDNIDKEYSDDVKELLKYREDSAGGIMSTDFISVPSDATVKDAIEQVRLNADEFEHIYHIYVINSVEKLLGFVLLKSLLLNPLDTKVKSIMEDELLTVNPELDQEEVANLMEKYDLVTIPVINSEGVMLGRITIDDVVDVIHEEAAEDIQKFAGLSEEEEMSHSSFKISRNRLPWLLVALVGELVSAMVLSNFQASIEKILIASFFIPIVMAMGGSSGTQAAIVMVRRLGNQEIFINEAFKKIGKEFVVALINGLVCGLLLLAATHYLFRAEVLFSVVLSSTLLIIMIFATIVGAMVPVVLKRFGADPAIATGPFVTTMNDIFSLTVYLSIVSHFLIIS
ncbi:MAG: magnesium transporter [Melioribacteraceae bacterium]|nr:magnesium transporter [Melioribacteraceae bacterium]